MACAIPDTDTDTVVITGGKFTLTTVFRYGKEGWIENFTSGLTTGRYTHGCTSFFSKDNERVKLMFDLDFRYGQSLIRIDISVVLLKYLQYFLTPKGALGLCLNPFTSLLNSNQNP